MEIPTLDIIIPGGSPHGTIQSAVNSAAAAQIGETAVVWIPPTYIGTDTYVNPTNVPVFDMRGTGSLNFGTTLPFSGVPTGSCMEIQTAVNILTGDFYSCVNGAWNLIGPGLSGISLDNISQGNFYVKQDFLQGPFPVLYNGNFEDTNPSQGPSTPARPLNIAGWVGNVNTTLSYETVNVYEGRQSLKVVCASSGSIAATVTGLYSYPVVPGDTWFIRGAARSDGVLSATIAIQFLDKNSNVLPHTNDTTSSTSQVAWQFLSATGVVPAGAVTAQIILWNPNTSAVGTMWFDGIEIFRVTNPAGVNSPSIQTNVFTLTNPVIFATLPAAPQNGTIVYCSDCSSATPCIGGGTGAIATRLNGIWTCGTPLVSPVLSPNPLSFDVNLAFKGPNPYVDITRFGARAVNPNLIPAAVGITANCIAGQNTVSISSASTFVNGDGVVIYGCGAPQSMATPSAPVVTPSVTAAPVNTLVNVNAPAGSTTYNYYLMMRDRAGGLTTLSPVGSTSTGATSLGPQTVNVSTFARSVQTVTVTTALAHGLAVGAKVFIGQGNSLSDQTFAGTYTVATVPDNLHFTYISGPSTALGASLSGTGGTASWYNDNKVTWTNVAGSVYAAIYSDRQVSGTCALIGVSNANGTGSDLEFDDFGQTFHANQSFPAIFPLSFPCASPPTATSDSLSTTIVSGAGTTTLMLASPAGTTINGSTIRLDAAPAINAAAAAIHASGGSLYIPVDPNAGSFVVNSWVDVSSVAVAQAGNLYLNDTFEMACPGGFGCGKWIGDTNPQQGSGSVGSWSNMPIVSVNSAHPGIFFSGQPAATHLSHVTIGSVPVNGTLGVLTEAAQNITFDWIPCSPGSGANDFLSSCFMFRSNPSFNDPGNITLDYVGMAPGGTLGQDFGGSDVPALNCRQCGNTIIPHAYLVHRGIYYGSRAGAMQVGVGGVVYINGGFTPLVTTANAVNNGGTSVIVGTTVLDTIAQPVVAVIGQGAFQSGVQFMNIVSPPSSGVLPLTGNYSSATGNTALPFFYNNMTGNSGSQGITQYIKNTYDVLGPTYASFVNNVPQAAPTCSVSAGGSLAVGTPYTFFVVPIWQNGLEGQPSPQSAVCTPTSGNQTITINWSTAPGNPKGYNLYYCSPTPTCGLAGAPADSNFGNPQSPTATSKVWSAVGFPSSIGTGVSRGGPTMLMSGTQGIATTGIILGNSPTASGIIAGLTGTGACATVTTQKGGAWAGQFTCTGTTGASTITITPGTSAPNGFSCWANDLTTAANILRQSASALTSCTIAGTVNANDVLTFGAIAF